MAGTEWGNRMRLDIYVGQHCANCQEACAIAEAARAIDGVTVRLIDWDDPAQVIPTRVVAVPTYVVDDQIVSFGNPDRQMFLANLQSHARRHQEAL
jgi:hypothetical protein